MPHHTQGSHTHAYTDGKSILFIYEDENLTEGYIGWKRVYGCNVSNVITAAIREHLKWKPYGCVRAMEAGHLNKTHKLSKFLGKAFVIIGGQDVLLHLSGAGYEDLPLPMREFLRHQLLRSAEYTLALILDDMHAGILPPAEHFMVIMDRMCVPAPSVPLVARELFRIIHPEHTLPKQTWLREVEHFFERECSGLQQKTAA
ncbi:MAG: hypothetical protein IKZ87_05535 [Actinomycetaceae bacterium]|nr:hypothetical protein [Actinomycetaceae bacterium]